MSDDENIIEDEPTINDLLDGNISFPAYNSDTEARDAGLTKGMLYQTSDGVLMVKL